MAISIRFSLLILIGLRSTKFVYAAPCTLCSDGSEPTRPEKLVQVPGYPEINCNSMNSIIPQLLPDESSAECSVVHQLSTLCGCPRSDDACNLCPDGSPVGNPDIDLETYGKLFGGVTPNCEVLEAYLHSFKKDDDLCLISQNDVAEKCGCPLSDADVFGVTGNTNITDIKGGIPSDSVDLESFGASQGSDLISLATFFGVKTEEQSETLYRVSLVSSVLSLIGCSIVLLDCLWSKKRRKNLYNQIIGTMAVFDILLSIASAFGTLPMPSDDYFVSHGEAGNEVTCKIQGFFIQWGAMTSIFLNASLSTYFLLVIVHGTRESRFRQLRKWLIGIPVFIGTVLAAASVPFIETGAVGCQLLPPIEWVPIQILQSMGLNQSWAAFLGCMIMPAFTSIAYSTGTLIRVYFHMRKTDKSAVRWRFRSDKVKEGAMKQTRRSAFKRLRAEVFWQSASYLLALYLTWFIYLSLSVNPQKYVLSHYELWAFIFFIGPLQGFLNTICYFRPRVSRYWSSYWNGVRARRRQQLTDSEAANRDDTVELACEGSNDDNIGAVEPAADLIRANEAEKTFTRMMARDGQVES